MALETSAPAPLPVADLQTGRQVLRELVRDRSLLTALTIMYRRVGPTFQITLPRFRPAVVVGAEANRQLLVTDRDRFSWRSESDRLRAIIDPPPPATSRPLDLPCSRRKATRRGRARASGAGRRSSACCAPC